MDSPGKLTLQGGEPSHPHLDSPLQAANAFDYFISDDITDSPTVAAVIQLNLIEYDGLIEWYPKIAILYMHLIYSFFMKDADSINFTCI